MKKWILCACALACGVFSHAQTGITQDVLKSLEGSYTDTPTDKALRNAMGATSIQKLTLNQDNRYAKDTHFSTEVKNSGISDQESSGRCWLFTGTNVLRNRAMRTLGVSDFFFSQVYLFFFDQLEKSNLFLQGVIDTRKEDMDSQMVRWLFQNPLSDGGTYTGVADLVTNTLFLDVFAYALRERFFRLYVERGAAHSQGRGYLVYGEVAFAVVRFYIFFEFIYETLVTFF